MKTANLAQKLEEKILKKEATLAVLGLGYVGLPLATFFANKGFRVLGYDIDPQKEKLLKKGESYLTTVPSATIKPLVEKGALIPSSQEESLGQAEIFIICVPTPLGPHQEPDLSFVCQTARSIASYLRPGGLVILESTTYPGTTREVLKPLLEESGLRAGEDFFLGYSPEREDPGNPRFSLENIPKVVSGLSPYCHKLVSLLYQQVVKEVVPVSSLEVAEATKLLENTYRAVNIALVNELKIIFEKLGLNIWEVIEAAKTKPFGFQAFYPGPGLGGHCIPVDPFYLTWKAKELEIHTRFIELAGEINTKMPAYVVSRIQEALNSEGKPLKGASIILLGVSYKPEVNDLRESPALKIMKLLEGYGALVDYHDPYVPVLPQTRLYPGGKVSKPLENLAQYDAVVVVTNHQVIDWGKVAQEARLIIDTRGVFRGEGLRSGKIWRA